LKTTKIEDGEEGDTILTVIVYLSMFNLQLGTFNLTRSCPKGVEKGLSLSKTYYSSNW
jgi:hypothetical protein